MRSSAGLVVALFLAFAAPVAHATGEERGETGAPAAAHPAGAEHGEEHESAEFNWAYGFVGEKDGVEPGLLYRPKGMAPPFLANLINAAILFIIIVSAGKKPVTLALKKRKAELVGSMEEAAKMKAEAEASLAEYERKLAHIHEEIERIRHEMRESAEAERQRILAEAKDRRDRMERDAKLLIEQELKGAHEALVRETVATAVRSAQEIIQKELGAADHDRIARDFLETVKKAPIATAGGRS